MKFKKKLPFEKVRMVLIDKFSHFKEFKSRVDRPYYFGWPRWVEIPNYDIADNIHHLTVENCGKNNELESLVSKIAEVPLNPSKPLWKAYIIDGFENDEKGVMYIRIHHCFGDGASCLLLLLYLLEAVKGHEKVLVKKRPTVVDKKGFLQVIQDYAGSITHLLFPKSDSKTVFHVDSPKSQKIQVVEDADLFSLPELKEIGSRNGNATVNDLILSSMAGAINEYVHKYSRQDQIKMFEANPFLKIGMWINMRVPSWFDVKPEGIPKLESNMASIMIPLPLDHSPTARLASVQKLISKLFHSTEPFLSNVLFRFLGLFPPVVIEPLWKFLIRNITLSLSNVPGPQYPLEICDIEMESISFFVNPMHNVSTMICLMSYNGKITGSICSFDHLIPNPKDIFQFAKTDFEKLKAFQ